MQQKLRICNRMFNLSALNLMANTSMWAELTYRKQESTRMFLKIRKLL
jgi:hypothetical protein